MRSIARLVLAAVIVLVGPLGVWAQEEYFGQNKVQYKNFKWEIMTTPHFEIYYYKGEEETARDAARMAEHAYARLSRILRHRISDPIPLILYASHSDFQQTNVIQEFLGEGTGGVTEFLKNRVFLPFTGSYAELEHVLTHELVHAFQGDIMFGNSPGASLLNPLAFQPPIWFMEGMAEYLSIGHVDEHTKMWLRDAALQGYLTTIPELNYTYDIRVYRFGQAIWAYIGNRYGDEKVGEILRKAPRLRSVDDAFKSAIGKNLQELSDAWTEDVRKTYLPQIAQFEKPKDFARQLTDHQKDRSSINLAPAISPRGDKMVFISDRSLYNDMYLASAIDGKVLTKLVAGERTGSFESLRFFSTAISWSPDERFIAFPAKIGAQDALYIMDVRKKQIIRRMKFGLDGLTSPSWSPDGQHLVFVGLQGGQSDIYTVDANGKNFRPLTQDRYTDRDPAWSPDGTKIALTTDRGTETNFSTLTFGQQQIALYDVATEQIEVLPNQYGKNISPQWSGDGHKIAFISDRTGISNLFIMDLETNQAYQITNILTGVTNITPEGPALSWAQKGNRLIFSAFSTGGWDIFSISDPVRLMKEPYAPPVVTAELSTTRPQPMASLAIDSLATGNGTDAAQPPVAVTPAAPDTMESVAFVDTTAFTTKPYSPRFAIDFVGGTAGYATSVGFVGQSVLSFSDVLGNHNILFGASVFGSLTDADLFFQYTNLTHRTNYGLALFQYRFDQYYYFLGPTVLQTQTQVNRGAAVLLSRPFSRFSRFEFSVQGVNRTRELVDITSNPFLGIRRTRRGSLGSVTFASPSVALVSDNSLYGITGPISGGRGRIEISPTVGELVFNRVLVDYRKYFNVYQDYAFALRAYGMLNHGRDQELLPFGGPYDFRGLDFWSVWGSKVGLFNLEFRFPLVEVLRLGWPLPLIFERIRGSLYLDAGGAWDQKTSVIQAGQYSGYPNAGTLDSRGLLVGTSTIEEVAGGPVAVAYGFGARSRLSFLVFKFDVAHQIDLGIRPAWFNNENIPGIPNGIEEEFYGTRSYRLRHELNDTKFFFTIGADF
ncbi:MAG: PD40 domain-containing protein [Candidatus Latescibacteria bacterium]|nr:PD40 domain-containing protein [Candidatus Latescibacterota bacterium]